MNDKHFVFQIQHYSLHDGPGIRTIVFLKGCPLRCRWCCNPESQLFDRQISYDCQKCIGKENCGWCLNTMASLDLEASKIVSFNENGIAEFDVEKTPEEVVSDCPAKALKIVGKEYSVGEILDIVEQDSVFYNHGNGGLTVSGGEPLMHGDYLIELLREAKKRRIHTAIETCGYGDYHVLHEAAKYLDYIMFDIKSLNEEKHIAYTGKSNQVITQNLTNLCADYPAIPKKIRTPIIPGFNDNLEDIKDILCYVRNLSNVEYEPLKYHKFGEGKYKNLGRKYEMGNAALDDEFMNRVTELVQQYLGANAGSIPIDEVG